MFAIQQSPCEGVLDISLNADASLTPHVVSRAFGWRIERHICQGGGLNMTEPAWQQARLIPTSGINGAQEQERRATSALLVVMTAVKEYGRTLTKGLGAHAGDIETFIEVEFDLDGKKVIPDGLIRVSRGSRVWAALVEVKTGRNELQSEQLENYLEVARRNGLQALLTISNQTSVADGIHPAKIDKRKLKSVDLHHMAWSEVLSRAVVEKEASRNCRP
jgi:hypothetical protein